MSRLLSILFLLVSCSASAAVANLDEALAEAGKRNAPVLLDFHAPWCYSCYYMKKNVLNGRDWDRVERDTVVLDVDADSPEGAALKERFQVKALPSYVVLNPQGDELGRPVRRRRVHADQRRTHPGAVLPGAGGHHRPQYGADGVARSCRAWRPGGHRGQS